MAIQLAVDIGGTFTDVVAREADTTHHTKVPTTPDDLIVGVRNGITEILAATHGDHADATRFVHGTTAGTNAVVERNGGTVGLLTTQGFRDTLAIGRQKREDMYDIFLDEQTPVFLAPRRRRIELEERTGPDGTILTPLNEADVITAADTLVHAHGVDAIAVSYLFSYANPTHEHRTAELVHAHHPDVHLSLSSAINPRFREYERLVVTLFDAYLRPVIEDYVRRLTRLLSDEHIDCRLHIMQSRGGLTGATTLLERPVASVLSGPAAAVAGASDLGARAGHPDLVTLDIGGTSCDVSLVKDGTPRITSEGTLQGYPLRLQLADINTIGSGGGSIAWLDDADTLQVGPRSAGADPGPACYGRGGTDPTVTDASLLLGYLNPTNFANGALALDPTAAEHAITTAIASPLGSDPLTAAKGIHAIANTKIAEQLRLTTVQRGLDPRRFSLFAMGGAGPTHAGKLAEALQIPRVIIPRAPGVLSAAGLLSAPVEHDHETTFLRTTDDTTPAELTREFADLRSQGEATMHQEGVPADAVTTTHQADMRYAGQSFEIPLDLPETFTPAALDRITDQFHARHETVYGHPNPSDPVEFVTLRTVHTHHPERLDPTPDQPATTLDDAHTTTRHAEFPDDPTTHPTPVYARDRLPAGATITGPAIIEQPDTTTVVYPMHTCTVDDHLNLLIDPAPNR